MKLNPNITREKENEIYNGIRNLYSDREVVMLQLSEIKEAVQTFKVVFSVLVTIIGIIALVIAFFLLLTSTT